MAIRRVCPLGHAAHHLDRVKTWLQVLTKLMTFLFLVSAQGTLERALHGEGAVLDRSGLHGEPRGVAPARSPRVPTRQAQLAPVFRMQNLRRAAEPQMPAAAAVGVNGDRGRKHTTRNIADGM